MMLGAAMSSVSPFLWRAVGERLGAAWRPTPAPWPPPRPPRPPRRWKRWLVGVGVAVGGSFAALQILTFATRIL